MDAPYLLIVAAGGYATRAFPLTGYGAKAKTLVNVGRNGATTLEEIVREARDSGIEEAVFVVSSEVNRDAFERYFDPFGKDPALRAFLERRGKRREMEAVLSRPTLERVEIVIQSEPRGFGDAISLGEPRLRAGDRNGRPFAGVLVALGDDIVHAAVPAMRQLVSAHRRVDEMIVAVQRVSREEATRFGVVVVEPEPLDLGPTFQGRAAYRVLGMEEKPPEPTPNRIGGEEVYLAVVGRYLIRPSDMAFLTGREGSIDAELDFTALQQRNAERGELVAVELDGTWHSVGTPFDAQRAFLHFALVPVSGEPTEEQQALRDYVRALLERMP